MSRFDFIRLLSFLVTLSVGCGLYAYGPDAYKQKLAVLENSRVEFVYQHFIYDEGIDKEDCREEILQLGQKYMTYSSYGNYRTDSVVQAMDDKKREIMSYTYYNNYIAVKYNGGNCDYQRLDLKLREVKIIYGRHLTQEAMPVQQWKLLPEEKEVMGYKCKKAACSFRGREWTAWYCPEIRIPYGPWKLNGLPGLILMAGDKSGAHQYVAIGLRTKPTPMYNRPMFEKGKLIDRKDYYRFEKDHCYNFCKGMWEAYNADPVNNDKPAVERLMFVPLELDFE